MQLASHTVVASQCREQTWQWHHMESCTGRVRRRESCTLTLSPITRGEDDDFCIWLCKFLLLFMLSGTAEVLPVLRRQARHDDGSELVDELFVVEPLSHSGEVEDHLLGIWSCIRNDTWSNHDSMRGLFSGHRCHRTECRCDIGRTCRHDETGCKCYKAGS